MCNYGNMCNQFHVLESQANRLHAQLSDSIQFEMLLINECMVLEALTMAKGTNKKQHRRRKNRSWKMKFPYTAQNHTIFEVVGRYSNEPVAEAGVD